MRVESSRLRTIGAVIRLHRQIAEFTGCMVEALTQVRKAYADIDNQVSQMFAGGSGGGSPQTAAGTPSAITERLG